MTIIRCLVFIICIVSANHEHRAGSITYNSFGGAAHEYVFPACVTVSGDHDGIAVQFPRCVDDFVPWYADPDNRPADQAWIDSASGGQGVELLLREFDNAR